MPLKPMMRPHTHIGRINYFSGGSVARTEDRPDLIKTIGGGCAGLGGHKSPGCAGKSQNHPKTVRHNDTGITDNRRNADVVLQMG